ncbi:hypothetical protein F0562_031496 [Nyssa sinensis]|uniref:Macro domain-containing protein n=1 Tax=Nyssa sinensis TaxID=561372 RepID=A0A5J5AUB1_9ASTE|nr:hypothetical protein F0562_031496 [Nyssa sinensis]
MTSVPGLVCRSGDRLVKSISNRNPRNLLNTQHTFKNRNNSPRLIIQIRAFSVISKMEENGGVASGGGLSAAGVPATTNGGDDSHRIVQFPLSPSSVLKIQKGDITQWFVDGSSDAIVNPANEQMLGGGGADGAIHRAAGPELLAACYNVPEVRAGVRCPTGEARITLGFRLPASHVIHTVGPIYDVDSNPESSLRSAYRSCLCVARDNNIQYIAFTAISCGVYGYPCDEAATVAISTVREFANDFKEVHFVLFSDEIYNVWLNKANELLQK